MATTSYATDGPTPIPVPAGFPVTWDDDVEPTLLWTWDEFHSPLPNSPMRQSLGRVTREGTTRAMRETGRYSPGGRRKLINGYPYSASIHRGPSDDEKEARRQLIDQAIGQARRRWDEEWQPRLERDLEEMQSVALPSLDSRKLLATIDRFLDLHSQHWYLHHLVVMPAMEAADRLEKRYEAIVGRQGRAVAHGLLHGAETKTVQSIRALDELATLAFEDHGVHEAIESAEGITGLRRRLVGSSGGREWLASFDRFLRDFGYRPGGFDFIFASWVEDPSFVLQNLRARLAQTGSQQRWEEQNSRLNDERDQMLADVRGRLRQDPRALAEFEQVYETAQSLWPLKEDHSHYIDQGSTALVRMALAEAGRRLQVNGVVANADDVWFLTIDEVQSALGSAGGAELATLATQRRADHQRWSRLRPPRHLGSYPAGYDIDSDGTADDPPAELHELRGSAASPGEATGVAVVVLSPEDFPKVRPGNILVCRSTAPMWTPLFQVVAALVSEAGGVLSHPAVVAREFGLPAVVGVQGATGLVRDGQILTVSGSSGLVRLGD